MPPLGPEIVASEFSTSSSGTSHSFTLPAQTNAGDIYILFIDWALSASIAAASPILSTPTNFVDDGVHAGWVRRFQTSVSNAGTIFLSSVWTGNQSSITVTDDDFTTNVAATAACVACAVNTHNNPSTEAYELGVQPNTSGTDGQVDHAGDSAFGEVEPQLYIDMMMGKVSDDAPAATGTSPASVPSGYTAEPGGEGPGVAGTTDNHFPIVYIAWKSSPAGQSSENPGAWVWDEVSDVTTPGNSALISVPFTTISFEQFIPDVEEDFPYWGLLGAMP